MGNDAVDLQEIQSAFTHALLRHLARLGVDEKGDGLEIERIEALTLFYLLHQREIELGAGGAPSVNRYNRKSLLADLTDIEPQNGSAASSALDQLIADGLVAVNDGQAFTLTPRAAAKVALYDAVFPGMPGLSFVAYLLQTMEEVLSGRKPLSAALQQVDQTLQHQGKRRFEKPQPPPAGAQTENSRPARNQAQVSPRHPSAAPPANLQQWYRLRAEERRQKPHPMVVSRSGYTSQGEVKTLFPRKNGGLPVEELETAEPGIQRQAVLKVAVAAEDAQPRSGSSVLPSQPAEVSDHPPDGGCEGRAPLQEEPCGPSGADSAPDCLTAAAVDPSGGAEPEADKNQKTAGGAPVAPQTSMREEDSATTGAEALTAGDGSECETAPGTERAAGGETGKGTAPESTPPSPDSAEEGESVQRRIAAFENDLAMHCPICRTGRIQAAVTPKGKTYYACSRPGCNFISWGKPYHYPCPVCRNPFLVEVPVRSQGAGLKCPRATCTYRQDHLNAPSSQTPSLQPPANHPSPAGNGLRKVVRKVVRRRRPS